MKQYYIQKNGQQVGPLTIEELIAEKPSRDSMVWHQGMEQWEMAHKVAELSDYFSAVPPPIRTAPTPTPPPINPPSFPADDEAESFWGQNGKKVIFAGLAVAFFAIMIFSFMDAGQTDVVYETQQNSQQLEEQQRLLDEQSAKIAEQERIENERRIKEQREAKERLIAELNQKLTTAYANVDIARKNVNDASAFQLLRSSSERNAQINAANEILKDWENEVERLETELRRNQ